MKCLFLIVGFVYQAGPYRDLITDNIGKVCVYNCKCNITHNEKRIMKTFIHIFCTMYICIVSFDGVTYKS